MDYDNQQTTSDNCDTFNAYRSVCTDSADSSGLRNTFSVFDSGDTGQCCTGETNCDPKVDTSDSGGGGCDSSGANSGGGDGGGGGGSGSGD